MKLMLSVLGVATMVAVFACVGNVESVSSFITDFISPDEISSKAKEFGAAFDPTWYENFKKADLVTKLQAVSGSAQK